MVVIQCIDEQSEQIPKRLNRWEMLAPSFIQTFTVGSGFYQIHRHGRSYDAPTWVLGRISRIQIGDSGRGLDNNYHTAGREFHPAPKVCTIQLKAV